MRSLLLLLFILATGTEGLGQSKSPATSKNDSIAKRLDSFEVQVKAISKLNDSLSNELKFYRQKEDLYIGLFERYSTRSEAMFGILLGLFAIVFPLVGIFTWGGIKRDLNKISHIQRSMDKSEIEFKHSQRDSFHAIGALMAALQLYSSHIWKDKKDNPIDAPDMLWNSLYSIERAFKFNDYQDFDGICNNITSLLKKLSSVISKLDVESEGAQYKDAEWIRGREEILLRLMRASEPNIHFEATKLNLTILDFENRLIASENP
ncbi:hypothetical protein [Dyadobacter fermentans]|uniref:hypothetical protein n=1 Tax=Dyadobacter fermentans TaxID=94254 RepID=UPI001CC12E52|nr:hypothetical protein [Dyadobacter fermentans]MBZ1362003.1 hypothetical protein [Dyadobacter fermentans]